MNSMEKLRYDIGSMRKYRKCRDFAGRENWVDYKTDESGLITELALIKIDGKFVPITSGDTIVKSNGVLSLERIFFL